MTLNEYIARLVELRAEHGGDLEVHTLAHNRREPADPRLAYVKITNRRERPDFWMRLADPPESKGEKVIRV